MTNLLIAGRTLRTFKKLSMVCLALSVTGLARAALVFTNSSIVPEATAVVQARRTGNDYTRVNLEVEHIAEPQKLDPGKPVFVVWVAPQGREEQVQNVGTLDVDKNYKASLDTIVPYRDFQISVTAENSWRVPKPTSAPLLWTNVNVK